VDEVMGRATSCGGPNLRRADAGMVGRGPDRNGGDERSLNPCADDRQLRRAADRQRPRHDQHDGGRSPTQAKWSGLIIPARCQLIGSPA
jgi:hypothetical protein